MDIYSRKKRSEIMSNVKGENNALERSVFSYLRKKGIYYQKHYKLAPGTPDIAIPSKKLAVFIEGSFWHGWGYAKLKKKLPPFWKKKIWSNILRDRRNLRRLKFEGWLVLRVWDHRLKKRRTFWLNRIGSFLQQSRSPTKFRHSS